VVTRAVQVRIEDPDGQRSQAFGWARMSVTDITSVAAECTLSPVDIWQEAGRWFAVLAR